MEELFQRISERIESARRVLAQGANVTILRTNYEIGRYIVEEEQEGALRAKYGELVLERLSERLTERYGVGWSVRNLKYFRQFYVAYSNSANTFAESGKRHLSWSHYLVLMRIDNPQERSFYEIEAGRQQWSVRELQRQYGASLYERLALSRDGEAVMRLAQQGQQMEKPMDILKNPFTLEFLGLKPDAAYSESDLEGAIVGHLQEFLLELGRGFLFEARQKRFTFDEEHYYVDLVFYNRLLQCYVLIDLKTGRLSHQDLGQMQMYVNYYDRYERQPFEKPTVGILLCKEKNDTLVELTLPADANVYAAAYALYLPEKEVLRAKLNEWTEEFEERKALS